jgi:GNAT superfamily N-acetyltransferase
MECNIIELDNITAQAYKPLTLGPYQYNLDRFAENEKQVLAVGLNFLGSPVGLGIALRNPDQNTMLLSLFVQENFRGRGYAGKMLSRLEEMGSQNGSKVMIAGFNTTNPCVEQFKRVLIKCGYSEPAVTSTIYRHSSLGLSEEELPWFFKYELPADPDGLFFWKDATTSEKEKLKNASWLPAGLSPFIDEHLIENLNSLAVRVNGEIVGWIIAHRLRSDTILYRSLYMREDFRNTGIAALMLLKSIKLQYQQGIPQYMLTIVNENMDVIPMINRWMVGYALAKTQWLNAGKVINS